MNEQLRDQLWDLFPDLIFYDVPVMDEAIIGLAMVQDNDTENWCVVYSEDQVIKDLMKDFGVDSEDSDYSDDIQAIEYYEYNILGGYLGVNTPLFYSENPEGENGFNEYKRCSDTFYFPVELKDVDNFEQILDIMKARDTIFFIPLSELDNLQNIL